MIRISNGKKRFKDTWIFKELNVEINTNGIHLIRGESGSGKTTLLNIIAGYEKLSEGSVSVEGQAVTIFQSYELMDELNVEENIYLYANLVNKKEILYEKEIIETLHLKELFHHYPNELSGGQKQLVGIARALFLEPSIILCDEPTEALDVDNKNKVMELLNIISQSCTVVLVSHDQSLLENQYDVLYEIKEESLCITQRKETKKNEKEETKTKHNLGYLNKVLNKISLKKTFFISLIISILTYALCRLMIFENKMFQSEKELDSLNENTIYFETENKELLSSMEVEPYLKVDSIVLNQKVYRNHIYPTTQKRIENFLVKGKSVDSLEVVVNQVFAESIGEELLNEEIELKYSIKDETYTVNTRIVGIVEEDLEISALYFVEENYEAYLKTKTNSLEENLYDLFIESSQCFEIEKSFHEIEEVFTQFEKELVVLKSPLYEQIKQTREDRELFYILFKIIEVFIYGYILFLIVVMSYKEMMQLMKSFTILMTSNIKPYFIKTIYLLNRVLIMIIINMLMYMPCRYYLNIYKGEERVILMTVISTMLLQAILLTLFLQKAKTKNVSKLLKDSRDEA